MFFIDPKTTAGKIEQMRRRIAELEHTGNRCELARKELSESEERFRSAFNYAPIGMALVDLDGRWLQVNRSLCQMLGYMEEELLLTTCREITHPEDRTIDRCRLNSLLNGEIESYQAEKRYLHKRGHEVNVLLNISLIRKPEGRPPYFILQIQDITERKMSETALKVAEANYRTIFNAANDVIFIHDPETGAILDANWKIYEMYGYTPEEARRLTVEQLSAGEQPYTQKEAVQLIHRAAGGEPQLFDWRAKSKTGRLFWVEVNLKLVFLEGRPRMLGVVRDISKRKEIEEALVGKMQDLARSNAELEQFAYVASHDLQEPLRMVSSFVQLLARRYQGKLGTDADEYISFAVEGAGRMQQLINDLLIYSRVGTRGKEFKPVDLEKVLQKSTANLQLAISESGAVITHDPLPAVPADGTQLIQLFVNLLSNAIKFRGQEAPRIHIQARKKEKEWLFAVRNNGIGIAPEFFERIFLIFQRLHSKAKYPGTGIGLAICKKIVERHGGRIWVESTPGMGTTFYFTIPAERSS